MSTGGGPTVFARKTLETRALTPPCVETPFPDTLPARSGPRRFAASGPRFRLPIADGLSRVFGAQYPLHLKVHCRVHPADLRVGGRTAWPHFPSHCSSAVGRAGCGLRKSLPIDPGVPAYSDEPP